MIPIEWLNDATKAPKLEDQILMVFELNCDMALRMDEISDQIGSASYDVVEWAVIDLIIEKKVRMDRYNETDFYHLLSE
jgi:hypothetical protein